MRLDKYRHFKGGEYLILGFAKHTETGEDLVIYVSVKTGDIFARPKSMWSDFVNGKQRFEYVFNREVEAESFDFFRSTMACGCGKD